MHRWKISVLAAAAIVSTGLFSADVHALALGQIHVRSALGEPLRADIDLPQVSAAEAESLKASTAAPDVYRAQGLEYTSALNDIRVQFQRRPDGTGVLKLSSSRAINDPFIDLVIDATWASGHIVRSYTMLLDPPEMRRAAPPVTTAPQITAPERSIERSERSVEAAPAPRQLPQVQERRSAAAAAQEHRAAKAAAAANQQAAPAPVAAPADGSAGEVRVQTGDTAGRIAGAHRPAGVSLDQMLVAMMRANPNAFINGNVNRLRAGTVLQIPTEAQAQATPDKEARKIIATQSRNFNEFRRRLAAAAPSAEVAAPQRAATGSVQTQVDDQKPAAASSDKLTLSKGGIQAQKKDEKLARDRQTDQNNERMAELSKNISDLNKLSTAAGGPAAGASGAGAASKPSEVPAVATVPAQVPGATTPAPAPAAATVASDVPATTPVAAVASAATDAASAASAAVDAASAAVAAASDAASAASAPAPKKPRKIVVPPPPPPEPTFLESLLDDPIKLGGIGALLALLLGYGGYKVAQRRKAQAAAAGSDSSIMDSHLAPDSFFGASGGQRVDTANSGLSTGSSSLAYSPSQLDAGEVDPVAEADVYLAYGRDLQAEEILREAARVTPERTSIHVKLAEIYAKRQDRKALEAQARELFTLTQGQGPDWARVSELGRTQDPENALYQSAAVRAGAAGAAAVAGVAAAGAALAQTPHLDLDAPSTLPVQYPTSTAPAPVSGTPADLDLDLDLGAAAQPHQWAPPIAPAPAPAAPPVAAASPKLPDFELPSLSLDTPTAPAPAMAPAADNTANALDFQLDDISFDAPATPAAAAPSPVSETAHYVETTARQPLEFDLDGLSLDLNQPTTAGSLSQTTAPAPMGAGGSLPDNPLSTKLALAEEFNAIGDSEGARTLVEEVIAEASGELKQRAQQMLAKLG